MVFAAYQRNSRVVCVACVQVFVCLYACNVVRFVLQPGHKSLVSFHFLSGLLEPLETATVFGFDLRV